MQNTPEICGAPTLSMGRAEAPRVTFALFSYNQEVYIRDAVKAALAQDYAPLEIILSDDGSSDRTFTIMRALARAYRGPHHVVLNRNPANLGLAAHVNHVLAMARGKIIVFAAGDDISLPGRVTDTVRTFARHPEAMAVSFEDIRIDDAGVQIGESTPTGQERAIDLETFLAAGPRAQSKLKLSGASRALRRRVYDTFGDLIPGCPAEDSPYLLRALYLGKVIVCGWPGIRYRVHTSQMSSERSISGMDPTRFMAQYRKDLDRVATQDLVPFARQRAVHMYFSERITAFMLRRLIYRNRVPDRQILLRVLMSPHYALREKAGLCKRFILRQGAT